jgi:hypothetical protein
LFRGSALPPEDFAASRCACLLKKPRQLHLCQFCIIQVTSRGNAVLTMGQPSASLTLCLEQLWLCLTLMDESLMLDPVTNYLANLYQVPCDHV